mgnify:FL=1
MNLLYIPYTVVELLFITEESGFEADLKACSNVRNQHVGARSSNIFGCNIVGLVSTPCWMMLIDGDLNLNLF